MILKFLNAKQLLQQVSFVLSDCFFYLFIFNMVDSEAVKGRSLKNICNEAVLRAEKL